MSNSISNATNPTIAASSTATPANSSSTGSSATVAAGSAQPTARSYANATKPVIASSGAPPVAVGGPQSAQHGKTAPISPVNGSGIKPAIPSMPAIVSGGGPNGNAAPHSRSSSVHMKQTPPTTGPPSGIKFGSIAGSPAPTVANLNPQLPNPRVASPAHSPSPIPTPISISGGPKPDGLPTRPNLVFGGQGSEGAELNSRQNSMPQQQNSLPQAQHLRRESSQTGHYQQQGGRGRGFSGQHYNPNMANHSPQPYRSTLTHHAHPQQMAGRGMAPVFQPQNQMPRGSPYQQNRSPAMTPATMHQQQHLANSPGMGYYSGQQFPQPAMYSMGPPHPGLNPYDPTFYNPPAYGLQQSIHYPGVPASPGRGHGFPQQMQAPYGVPTYNSPSQPQSMSMSRTPSNMSERPPSAVPQPSTPAMTNVNHISHTPSVSNANASPGPSTTFERPAKKPSKAIVIKNPDGEVVDFKKPKGASPAPAVVSAPPPAPRSPAIAATPTPPPRVPSASDSARNEENQRKQADFVKQFQETMRQKEEADKKAKEAEIEAEKKAKEAEIEAEKKAKEAELEAEKKAKEEAEAKAAQEAKEAAEAKAAEEAKAKEAEEAEKKRLEDEEMERMIAEMEEEEKRREEEEKKYEEIKRKRAEEEKANVGAKIKQEEERLRKLEQEAEEEEAKKAAETPEQRAERELKNKELFAGLKKNTQFGPGASGASEETSEEPTPKEPVASQAKPLSAKPKPASLKLDMNKSIEPAQPTAGMQALKSARFLQVRAEVLYPQGIASPNPALNMGNKKGRSYDKDFLLQFQEVFKEKPSVDWDTKLKETVGDEPSSARGPPSGRPSSMMAGRQPSRSGAGPGVMGQFRPDSGFTGGRTLPPGTTSEQRFQQAQGRGSMTNPLAHVVGMAGNRGGFPMAQPMARSGSYTSMPSPGGNRVGSSRGKGSRRGGPPTSNKDEKAMPLTAGQEVKALDRSQTGWKPLSITQPAQERLQAGHMAPDVVQRKVKAALNKMTPEKFDKISDQILEIAGQSKDESDGRTLRQVIQLTFEKACDEAHWAGMYAKFANRMLQTMSPDIKDENVKDKNGNLVSGGSLFRKYLLNRCQEEFERGWQLDLPEAPEDGKEAALLSDEYYVAAAAKRRGLGLIQFIGELYKLGMLTLRIMHECVLKLLDFEGAPDEAAVESLVKLLKTVGSTMESAEAGPKMISMYFERIQTIMNMKDLPSRLQFMLLDTIDLRKSGWKSKDILKGPKTIAEIHQEAVAAQQAAEMERTRSNQRGGGGGRPAMGRGDARSFSGNMMPPQDTGGRVQMDDLRKLSKGASGRNLNTPGALGPSMLGNRSGSGRRGLGPGMMGGRGEESGASSRTGTPPVTKDKDTTSSNAFSALAALENDNDNAGEVGSPPATADDSASKTETKPSQ